MTREDIFAKAKKIRNEKQRASYLAWVLSSRMREIRESDIWKHFRIRVKELSHEIQLIRAKRETAKEAKNVDSLQERCSEFVRVKFSGSWPHRTGSASWAGGDNAFYVKRECVVPEILVTSNREWSKNGKWSGNSYSFGLGLPRRWWFDRRDDCLVFWRREDESVAKRIVYRSRQKAGMSVEVEMCLEVGGKLIDCHSALAIKRALKVVANDAELTAFLEKSLVALVEKRLMTAGA